MKLQTEQRLLQWRVNLFAPHVSGYWGGHAGGVSGLDSGGAVRCGNDDSSGSRLEATLPV